MENWLINSSKMHLQVGASSQLLPQAFYCRDTLQVAQELLGKVLAVSDQKFRIVEVEAYGKDPASHAYRGPTPRSQIMFGPPGFTYVYFIYGVHEMLNIVTEAQGTPGAVLIRALEPLGKCFSTSGPGRLTRALKIKRSQDNGLPVFKIDKFSRFKIFDGKLKKEEKILSSPRVGIRLARDLYWRFFLSPNLFVSQVSENQKAR